ncbi:MAG: TonB-dependent receptor [Owenweeksia sp.]
MKILRILLLIAAGLPLASWGQISGVVKGLDNGKEIPLPGANVIWEGSETGTTTAKDGSYTIEKVKGANTLKVSYIGYQSQSKIVISRTGTMNFTLEPSGYELEGAEVVGKVDATTVDVTKAGLSYKIDDKELRKAACCNLSESFETNASVDVSFTDAVTGTRQIEMLGLSGKYALIQRENIPFARGLNSNTGLTYIPGPFVESIQLTKGLSSVLNGYEGITGQINVEFYKPETAPKLYLNAFGNQGSRTELNVMSAIPVNKRLSTAILAHASAISIPRDGNDDGFADIPNGSQLNFTNRWHFKNPDRGWEGQIGVSAVQSKKVGGQMDYITEDNPGNSLWGFESDGRRAELFGKNGYVFKDKPFRSIGIIYSLTYQDHNGRFGERFHYGEQQNAYLNTIYQDIIGSTIHKYRTGISFQLDQITDRLSKPQLEDPLYLQKRTEAVPGAYFEYTLEPNPRFTLVAGIRGDYNNYFEELYITPRLNVRYSLSDHTTFRLGGGRGQRTANVMLENLNLLASSRTMDFTALGISPEVAWNTGASLVQDMRIIDRKLTLTVDAFYTWFDNKVVADLDVDPNTAYFISSTGSRSLSVLSQIDYELSSNFEVRLAYKYLNAKDQFAEELRQSYLIPEHRAFVNLAYQTEQRWKFDLTLNWFGSKRLPDTETSPDEFKRDPQSPGFFTVNAQINKTFKNGLEIFAGVDNLLDFRQDDPIVNADNPYSPYFDTNFTWGPVFGRNVYVGLYYTLPDKEN